MIAQISNPTTSHSLPFQWANLLTLMEHIMHVGVMTCKVHLYGLNPHLWTIMCVGVPQLREGEEVTPEHEHDLFCNAQAVRVIQSSLCTMEYNKVRGMISAKEI